MADDSLFRSNYAIAVNKFQGVRAKAFWQDILNLVTRQNSELMSFDEVRARFHLHEEYYKGIHDLVERDIVDTLIVFFMQMEARPHFVKAHQFTILTSHEI